MIPISDTKPEGGGRPVATMVLMGLLVLVFLTYGTQSKLTRDEALFRYTAVPCELMRGEPLTMAEINRLAIFDEHSACGYEPTGVDLLMAQSLDQNGAATEPFADGKRLWFSLPASLFFHLGWLHLVATIWALWIFGDNVELRLGWPVFLVLFLVSGLAGVIANVAVNPDSILPTIGSGGAVAGVLGCYTILFPDNTIKIFQLRKNPRELSAANFTIIWLGIQMLIALSAGPVPWAVAFAGFAVGILWGIAARLATRWTARGVVGP